jgi:hypothetical protein
MAGLFFIPYFNERLSFSLYKILLTLRIVLYYNRYVLMIVIINENDYI